jgi:type IV secretion system protein VirB5
MRKHNLVSALALSLAIGLAGPVVTAPGVASAQMAVFDASSVANTAQQITQLKAQLDQMVKTYETVTSQLRKAEEAYNAVTGVRNLGDIFNNPALRKYLPADMKRVYDATQVGGYRGISGTVDEILKLEALSGSTKDQMREINERSRRSAATSKLVGEDAYEGAQLRMEQLDNLLGQINKTQDPKALGELQARIAMEQASLQNEAIKLQLMAHMAQAERQLVEEQRRAASAAILNPANTKMFKVKRASGGS